MKKLSLKFLVIFAAACVLLTASLSACSGSKNTKDADTQTTVAAVQESKTSADSADSEEYSSKDEQSDDLQSEDLPEEDSKENGQEEQTSKDNSSSSVSVVEDGEYTSKEEVAAYIHEFGHLPDNYITKSEAKELGWNSGSNSSLDQVAPGKSIGGDRFGNNEGLLPKADGRKYYECDIDYVKGSRNAKRIIYSNDGLIYYTEDHYNTFELLYGEE